MNIRAINKHIINKAIITSIKHGSIFLRRNKHILDDRQTNIEEGINAFFKAKSIDEARVVLYSMQINPRDKINAFYSSIITSDIDKKNLVHMLQTISKADVLYGKIMKINQKKIILKLVQFQLA